jgi:RimJ/RimL family protein N-acetyltransferase
VSPAAPRIRPARPVDAAEIARWFPDRSSAVLWGGPHVPDPVSEPWLAREFEARARAHFVAVDEDEHALGLIGMRRRLGERRVHLIRVAVAPEHRGEGLSLRLIESMATLARLGGARRLTLNVYGANTPALRAYEKAGFRLSEIGPPRSDPAGTVLRMTREV